MQKRRLNWLWILLGAVVVIVGVPVILFGFLLFQNEPSLTDPPSNTEVSADLRAADETFLGSPFPPAASIIERFVDERAPDKLLVLSFETNEADAVAYVQSLTGRQPEPGFSIQDLEMKWWQQRPKSGRGAASDPEFSPIAKRVLLSEPNKEGKTSVWLMANET
jgi:hypothetical protein